MHLLSAFGVQHCIDYDRYRSGALNSCADVIFLQFGGKGNKSFAPQAEASYDDWTTTSAQQRVQLLHTWLRWKEQMATARLERELGLSEGLSKQWIRRAKRNGEQAFPGHGRLKPKNEELRRENEIVRQEHDIWK